MENITKRIIEDAARLALSEGIKRMSPRVVEKRIGRKLTGEELIVYRRVNGKLKKERELEALASGPVPVRVEISYKWNRNPAWGWNPSARARVEFEDGSVEVYGKRVSGSGYDKLSSITCMLLDEFMKGPLLKAGEKPFWNEGSVRDVIDRLKSIGYDARFTRGETREWLDIRLIKR